MGTLEMSELRHQLRQNGILLRFPKPGILRAYLKQSPYSRLHEAVIGNTFCAISNRDPSALSAALQALEDKKNIILLGG